ncbi:MAG: glycosyltransferase [Coriobacteriales bacterium]|nr:glycosyltransferase [Coriobacteriales bacterium]
MTTKVLELFGEPIGFGGQESYVITQLSHMDRDGLSFDCLSPYACENEDWRLAFQDMGGRVFTLGLPFRPGSSRELLRKPLRDFLAQHAYDVVHIQSGSTTVLSIASAVASDAGVPLILAHSHSANEHMTLKKRAIRRAASLEMRRADVLCACSVEAALSKFLPSRLKDVRILNNGIDVERFEAAQESRDALRAEAGIDPSTIVVGNVGRLSEAKNQSFAIDVFGELLRIHPDAVLWLVGDGEDREMLEAKVARKGLADSTRFLGARSDVENALACMDVFLFPSLWEGLGIAVLEAQAAGLPCIVSNVVPRTVEVCPDYVTRLSLSDPASQWAEAVLQKAGRRNTHQAPGFRDRGFAANETARELRQLYLSRESAID